MYEIETYYKLFNTSYINTIKKYGLRSVLFRIVNGLVASNKFVNEFSPSN